MRTTIVFSAAILAAVLQPVAGNVGASAWSGSACSGLEVGSVEVANNFDGLSNAEATPNAACVHFDTRIPANCDVYLCEDAACNDQGRTVAGPQAANTKLTHNFAGMQIGCQQ
ncbi:hypothetical protein E1B28_009622 [Marasmius oreades]|uniref:Uncharacterized protein n=1 Tax=Marasmius oreades TaxID=181124 RepID=A0A9P7RVG9_9AGAR|nr:uncharacterized protein E1B28_009622 [Marasmius oreades]KAG7090509.1 hypothetical protein E1B28_009622 [Marasmius oreades]